MLIRELTLRGILSFGLDAQPLDMRPLNLLVGPNGAGKSNLLEAISLFQAAPSKLTSPLIGSGGGVKEWIWKGSHSDRASLEAVVDLPNLKQPIRHRIEFAESASRFLLTDEAISDSCSGQNGTEPFHHYQIRQGRPRLAARNGIERKLQPDEIATDLSILSQRRDPDQYPELYELSKAYGAIRLFREWTFGRDSVFRVPQQSDLASDQLEEDFSNLGLFLNRLRERPRAKKQIIEKLGDLYEGLDDFDVRIQGGTVDVFLTEGDFTIPARRLSDGTLRYLCLLAILCDPDPPPLICIEEPELGLHPDIIPKVADLLVEASERTQLIVTSHSDLLVDAMTEQPDSVVVLEKHSGKTEARRLTDSGELNAFLKDYRLGEIWMRGMIGGTRW